jgi:hypothetical protein
MISKIRPKKIAASSVMAAVALCATAYFTAAQSPGASSAGQEASTPAQSLDYEFFKTRVEPIFLKKRPGHARCSICHSKAQGGTLSPGNLAGQLTVAAGGTRTRYLEKLSPEMAFWTEDQSRRNFQRISRMVVPGDPTSSRLLMHPLAPEAGGDDFHGGGRQFTSQNDPDWQTLAEWVRGKKAGAPSEH